MLFLFENKRTTPTTSMPGIIKKAANCANARAPKITINKKKDFTKSSISLVDFITPVVFDH